MGGGAFVAVVGVLGSDVLAVSVVAQDASEMTMSDVAQALDKKRIISIS